MPFQKHRRLITLIALPLAIYAITLTFEFVRWDDSGLIIENELVRTFSPMIFFSYDPELYIPITLLSFQLEVGLFGITPVAFHLTNVVLHILNVLLVFWFIRLLHSADHRAGKHTRAHEWGLNVTFVAALLFAAHPFNAETVSWVSARKELLMTLFTLLSLGMFLKAGSIRSRALGLSLLFALLAMMSKPTAIVIPILILLIEWRRELLTKGRIIYYAPFIVLSGIFSIIGFFGKEMQATFLSFGETILLSLRTTTFVFQKLFVPINFSAIYPAPDPITLANPEIFLSLCALIVIAVLLFLLRKNRSLILGVGFFLIALAPSFFAYLKSGDVAVTSDRYVYLPSIGLMLAAVALVQPYVSRFGKTFSIIVITTLSVLAFQQARTWSTSSTLFHNVLRVHPDSHTAYNNLGNAALKEGDFDAADKYLRRSLDLKPNYPDALTSLGALEGRRGNYELADEHLHQALFLNANHMLAHFNLGGIAFKQGRYEDAVSWYEKAVALDSYNVNPHWMLTQTYLKMGNEEKALGEYRKTIEIDGSYRGRVSKLDILL